MKEKKLLTHSIIKSGIKRNFFCKTQCEFFYWPWKGGLPEVPAEDGGEFIPLLRSGIGWTTCDVKPRRWAMPCSFVVIDWLEFDVSPYLCRINNWIL
jgi:hypothetical protein